MILLRDVSVEVNLDIEIVLKNKGIKINKQLCLIKLINELIFELI